ncbi:hypothetical protein RHIZ404_220906 [Rhizobium sp. EC-SD404]|nr:hypothetical protein RHIZ404_220906 [Rhizobium sp. EC-SD404]
MAERGPCHHGEGDRADRADRPEMDDAAIRHRCPRTGGNRQKAKRHEQIAEMEDEEQRFAKRRPAAPARQPEQERKRRNGCQGCSRSCEGHGDPGNERQRGGHHRDPIDPSEARRRLAAALGEPVAGEARHDAPADQDDKHDEGRNRHAKREVGLCPCGDGNVEERVCNEQQYDQADHHQIAPVVATNDFANRDRDQRSQKGKIADRCGDKADRPGGQHGNPARDPDSGKRGERPSLDRQSPGPVRDRRQQEPGNRRRRISEQEFVCVPVAIAIGRSDLDNAAMGSEPERHREATPKSGEQEKGAKALIEDMSHRSRSALRVGISAHSAAKLLRMEGIGFQSPWLTGEEPIVARDAEKAFRRKFGAWIVEHQCREKRTAGRGIRTRDVVERLADGRRLPSARIDLFRERSDTNRDAIARALLERQSHTLGQDVFFWRRGIFVEGALHDPPVFENDPQLSAAIAQPQPPSTRIVPGSVFDEAMDVAPAQFNDELRDGNSERASRKFGIDLDVAQRLVHSLVFRHRSPPSVGSKM